jgi:succinoglycan biosynthesis transport protein ExoP
MRDHELYPISLIDRQPRTLQAVRTDEGVTVGDILRRLLTHRWFIAACGTVCVLLSLLYVRFKPAVYEATAVLRIDPGRADSLAMTDRPAAMPSEPGETLHTEIVILKGDDVAIRTLNTLTDDEFTRFTGSRRGTSPIPQDVQNLSNQQQGWIGKLEKALTVKGIDGTQLITVTVRHNDPKIAAALDNDVIRAYTVQTFEDRAHSVAQLRTWLSTQMDELKNHVETSQAKLTDFEQANDVVGTGGTSNTIADRLHFLSERLSTVQSDRIMKEAQMRAASGGSPSELATLFPNPKLSTLQAAQGTLYAQYAQLSSKFGPNYPPLADLAMQMRRIDVEISGEVQSVRERLSMDYAGAKRAQDMLQSEYDKQIALAYQFNRNQAEYTVLQGDVTASKELYDALRRKLQQATVDTEVGGLNTVLVQGARVPMEPAGPRRMFILLGSLILGLFAGVVAAVIFDGASDRVQGAQQIERELGLPVLAHIRGFFKEIDGIERHGEPWARRVPLVLGAPSSRAAEAIRALRNSVILSAETKTVMVTSGHAGEGALQVAVNLAILLAHSGARRVLLVDTDLQKPRAQGEFGVDNGPGLGEYLAGESLEPKPIRPVSHLESLFMVTGGNATSASCDLLTSATFHSLLLKWRRDFDYVVVIGAPLLVENVGMLLASWVDATVLIAQDGQSRFRELKQICDTLQRNRARIQGVVISDVPSRSAYKGKAARLKETRNVYSELAKQAQTAD